MCVFLTLSWTKLSPTTFAAGQTHRLWIVLGRGRSHASVSHVVPNPALLHTKRYITSRDHSFSRTSSLLKVANAGIILRLLGLDFKFTRPCPTTCYHDFFFCRNPQLSFQAGHGNLLHYTADSQHRRLHHAVSGESASSLTCHSWHRPSCTCL